MALALYAPGLGYYANGSRKFGRRCRTASGSDFVTAPELSRCSARRWRCRSAGAAATGTDEVWEFGAGSGALARSCWRRWATAGGALHHRRSVGQPARAPAAGAGGFGDRVHWADASCPQMQRGGGGQRGAGRDAGQAAGARSEGVWHERGVVAGRKRQLVLGDRPTDLRPPVEVEGPHDYLTEIHPRPRLSCARWPTGWSGRGLLASTTALASASTTTRSATWAR
jgi:hypothetical protein